MKTIFYLLTIFTLFACDKDKQSTEPNGHQDDTIKLSTKELTFNTSSATKEIITEGEQWEMHLITNEDDSNGLDYTVENLKIIKGNIAGYENTPLTIESDWFIITRELKKIKVELKQNKTEKNRTVKIGVSDRNYFDRITVEQLGAQ